MKQTKITTFFKSLEETQVVEVVEVIKLKECYECRENDKMFITNLHYKCHNNFCINCMN